MKNRLCMVLLIASLPVLAGGCALFVVGAAGAAAGVGGYAYVNGESTETLQAPMDSSWNATLGAMKDFEFPIATQAKDALQADLVAHNAAGKRIEIKLKKLSQKTTEIRIRVGTFGDESLSQQILSKIKQRL